MRLPTIAALIAFATLWGFTSRGNAFQQTAPVTVATRTFPAAAPGRFDPGLKRFGVLWSGMRRSIDDGKTWEWIVPASQQPFHQPFFLLSSTVFLARPDVGLLTGGRGGTWRIAGDGKSWRLMLDGEFGGIAFADSSNGWLALNRTRQPVGDNYVTRDGGETWRMCGNGVAPHHAQFLSVDLGWGIATGVLGSARGTNRDVLVKTIDGGCSWTAVSALFDGEDNTIHFLNEREGWVGGEEDPTYSVLRHTADGGKTWQTWRRPQDSIFSVYFTDAQHGWLDLGVGISATSDGGATWNVACLSGAACDLPLNWDEGQFRRALIEGARREASESIRRTAGELDRLATRKVLPKPLDGSWDANALFLPTEVDVTIDAGGNVIDAKCINQTLPEAMEHALDAAKQWTFQADMTFASTQQRTFVGPVAFLFRQNGTVEEAIGRPIR